MPPKDLPSPNPQDAESLNQPTEAQDIPQIPQKSHTPVPLSEFSRKYTPTLNEDLQRAAEEYNRAIAPINERLRVNGLTPAIAMELVQLDDRLHFGTLDLINQAVRVAAVDLGLVDVDDPKRDIRAAATFSEFSIDPRIAIKEYRDFPWQKVIARTLRAGETLPAKPSFATFAKMILHSAVLVKSRELYEKARELESTINPEVFSFGHGFRGAKMTPTDEAKWREAGQYKGAEKTIKNAASGYLGNLGERRLSLPGNLSPFVYSELVNGSLTELRTTRLLAENSQFVDDILTKTAPVQVSNPYGTRSQPPIVDLATLIKPKTTAPK